MDRKKKKQPAKAKKKSSKVVKSNDCGIDPPKRFLTAYNFYFMHERAALLNAGKDEAASSSVDTMCSASSGTAKPWTKKSSEKRKHVKTHGKIAFGSLGKIVATKWKALSAEERKVYDDLAKDDMQRYRCEMSEYSEKIRKMPNKLSPASASEESLQSKPCHETSKMEVPPETISSSSIESSKKRPSNPGNLRNLLDTKMPVQKLPPNRLLESGEQKRARHSPDIMQSSESSCVNTDLDNVLNTSDTGQEIIPFNIQTNKLFGRDQQISSIMDAYKRFLQSQTSPEMVIISGYSGAGKSALVQHLKRPITDFGGHFICGKFDCFRQMEPLSAIIVALSKFCNEVPNRGTKSSDSIKSAVQEMVGSETEILADVMPNFRQFFQTSTPSNAANSIGGKAAHHRLKIAFRLFFRAIASPENPLVLFLDDLQWADLLSLDLIESLITDTKNKYFFLICSYRSNEVGDTHPLASSLRNIKSRGVITINIKVDNLGRESVNELISDVICTPPQLTQSLSNIIYRKTNGNPLFVLQFLRSIYDEKVLNFQSDLKQWQWDASTIESKKIADDVVELMLVKIQQFSNETQNALKVLACMGSDCEEWILNSIMVGGGVCNVEYPDLITPLEVAVEEGLVDYIHSTFKFAHDDIQRAAYSLIPENEKSNLHLMIGSRVWANASQEKALFVAVGQFNKSTNVITDAHQRIEVAKLNLQAVEKSMSLTAFGAAAFYSKIGIKLLGENSWVDHYYICLKLHTLYAEALYCSGEFKEMYKILPEIFSHAKCHLDKLRAYFTSIGALMAQSKNREALSYGLQILSQLGEPMPEYSDSKLLIVAELTKTKHLMEGKTDAELLSMKKMEDEHKIAAMRVMNILALACFFVNHENYSVLALRMVQLSLQYGICNESAFGFASYGGLMISVLGDFNCAYRFGKLSLSFLGKSQADECLPGVYACVYVSINPFIEHFRASIPPLVHSYKVGVQCGQLNYAMATLAHGSIVEFFCGENIVKVERKMRVNGEEMIDHKQEMFNLMVLPYRQACLNLMGRSDDPEQLNGKAMNQEQLLKQAHESNHFRLVIVIYHVSSWLAYLFGNYGSASRLVEKRQSDPVLTATTNRRVLFVDGLIAFAAAHETNQTKWSVLGSKVIEELNKYALHAPSNYKHMVLLLQAESASHVGKYGEAAKYYDAAIKIAGDNGFIQDQALAYERAARMHSKQGKPDVASGYYLKACNAYQEWGACRLAERIRLRNSF